MKKLVMLFLINVGLMAVDSYAAGIEKKPGQNKKAESGEQSTTQLLSAIERGVHRRIIAKQLYNQFGSQDRTENRLWVLHHECYPI
jgi:hypothetical protein